MHAALELLISPTRPLGVHRVSILKSASVYLLSFLAWLNNLLPFQPFRLYDPRD